jgi:hybrid polyketide synthase/nonribosomal peptide synthetase ACE1
MSFERSTALTHRISTTKMDTTMARAMSCTLTCCPKTSRCLITSSSTSPRARPKRSTLNNVYSWRPYTSLSSPLVSVSRLWLALIPLPSSVSCATTFLKSVSRCSVVSLVNSGLIVSAVYGDSEEVPTYAATGSARSILSNRLSYFFNWHGPSMTIDTACSSSLIAVHQAVQVLRSGESPVAIAAGSNLILGPTMFVAESNLNMLSPHGRSRMWDASANGYARGEGVAAVVLKTLSTALRDGDHIECIIRETGVNQDGKTPGITMPSSSMQAALIHDTYTRAGLDPRKETDRCQYFEAHGTGTPAGDPQEAGAIHKSFFEDTAADKKPDPSTADQTSEPSTSENILYVGSIKTVIGHTEGTAGIAGLLKASLAMQAGIIPPNMHFTKLNPAIKPFYDNLKIPVRAQKWPELPPNVPKRCSINSFGFGGANAHAIIESYEPAKPNVSISNKSSTTPWPFVLSAPSEKSLAAQLKSYINFADENPDFPLDTLSWSLFRRTPFSCRIAFSATSLKSLVVQMEKAVMDFETKKAALGVRANAKSPLDILGIFTGQGAQWATMGKELILSSTAASQTVEKLEQSLSALSDGPDWSLRAELLAPAETSRIAQAEISQPLCTAVQILVVDLLQQAGVRFSSVVGHSSGEIACAYVSGFISATDAIRVAYYRGKYAPLAKGGAMVAAGTDMQDAIDLCSLPKLKGKAQLAANNSSASVTISGDAEAIDLVDTVMRDEAKFSRKLRVDTAYHSHHMLNCSEPYLDALERCQIKVNEPVDGSPKWYTSVLDGSDLVTSAMAQTLQGTYWRDNMVRPVRFAQAMKAALEAGGRPGLALEVGSHPALQGPASLNIEEAIGSEVPYYGTLQRGKHDALALASTIGSIWTALGATGLDLQRFMRAFDHRAGFELSKDLPGFTWDHAKPVWNETRASRQHRFRAHAKHDLLGIRSSEEIQGELRWRNYLKPKEMSWLNGHQIQGQIVFPAAGFAVMAFEAARNLAPMANVRLMRLEHFVVHKALSFMDENTSVETVFVLNNLTKEEHYVEAAFSCSSCLNKESGEFGLVADGRVRLLIGQPSEDALPVRPRWVDNFVPTQVDFFYESLATTGYGYTEMFQGITELQRTNGGSRGTINIPQDDNTPVQNWLVHPATIDVAFQGIFAAVGAPGDGRLWTLHLPTIISSITINPNACEDTSGVDVPLPFDAHLVDCQGEGIAGDVDIYNEDGDRAIVQIEGLKVSPVSKHGASEDRDTFSAMSWGLASPDLTSDWKEPSTTSDEEKITTFAERLSFFIIRSLSETVDAAQVASSGSEHQKAILSWAKAVVQTVQAGEHPTSPRNWLMDTWDLLQPAAERLAAAHPQIRRCLQAKEQTASLFSPEQTSQPASTTESSPYTSLPHFEKYNSTVAELVTQISFRHRNMKVLEIGTGEGASTLAVLGALGQNFTSYTCTDADDTGFDLLKARIPEDQVPRVHFKTLELDEDLEDQDFSSGEYDLIIACNSIHRSPDLQQTLGTVRSLLKPGGFLAMMEPTNRVSLAIALTGSLEKAWFSAIEDYRQNSLFVPQVQWDVLLHQSGFSGIDTATPEPTTLASPFSVMCSVAVDKEFAVIKAPLDHISMVKLNADLLILGGQNIPTQRLVKELTRILAPSFNNIINAKSVTDLNDLDIENNPTVLSLVELDEPVFRPFTEPKFKAVVKLCDNLKKVLWVTKGSRGENPYASMMTAVGRCLVGETPTLRMQFLNFDGNDKPTPDVLAHYMLQLQHAFKISGEGKAGEPLFTFEREMTISNGNAIIPRYLPVKAINDRLNSERRSITRALRSSDATIRAVVSQQSYKLLEIASPTAGPECEVLNVHKSCLAAVRVGNSGCHYLVLGQNMSGQKVVTLSETLQTAISADASSIVPIEVSDADEAGLLNSVVEELIAETVLSSTTGAVFVHEPTPAIAHRLTALAADWRRQVVFTSSSILNNTVLVHHSTPDRVVSRLIPKNTTLFVDFSKTSSSSGSTVLSRQLARLMPFGCLTWDASQLLCREAFTSNTVDEHFLRRATLRATSQPSLTAEARTIPASEIPQQLTSSTLIVDWKSDESLPVSVRPAEEMIRFRSDRTYLLVGLTGQLGLQLTKWMVQHGAKYLALASRNPQVDPDWLERISLDGAVVKTFAMDITSRNSVRDAYKRICAQMPAVAGVCNGAMILIDGLFANKTFADFEKTLLPKVQGTVYLDELFDQDTLDFFMVFSSLAAVAGNIGQTAYASANTFMCSLVAGRRMRGLAGSAINMPGIVGLGYLNRDPRKLERLKGAGYINISEWDFYQFFSEAVIAGHPRSGTQHEITAGLMCCEVEKLEEPPLWTKHARFSPLKLVGSGTTVAAGDDAGGVSVRTRLLDLTTAEEVQELLLEGLLDTLYTRLKMDPEERGITPDTAIVELGVDSLLAVNMRAWFTKELDLDMPVLKILGGATVRDLVEDAFKRLSPALVPKLNGGADGDSAAVKEEAGEESGKDEVEANTEADAAKEALVRQELEPMTVAPLDLPTLDEIEQEIEQEVNQLVELPSHDSEHESLVAEVLGDLRTPSSSTSSLLDNQTPDTSQPPSSESGSDSSDVCTPDSLEEEVAFSGQAKLFSSIPTDSSEPLDVLKKVRMSYGASRFWLLSQYLQDPNVFNLGCEFKLFGKINEEEGERCVFELGQRHEAFRTAFIGDPENFNEPTMAVLRTTKLRLERRKGATEADVKAEFEELLNHEYRLELGEVIRMKLISINETTHYVLFGFHHIAMDGFSFNTLISDCNMLYDRAAIEPVRVQYSDFATRQRAQVMDGSLDNDYKFWEDMYSTKEEGGESKRDFPEPLPLFKLARSSRQPLDDYDYHEVKIDLDTRTVRQIKAQCRRHKITTFHFFLGVLRVFLFRHLEVDDLVIGIADANRLDADIEQTVGFMLNLLPLRFKKADGDEDKPFSSISEDVRTTVYDALAHSRLPFDALLERLNIPRSTTHSPLFQAFMDYRPFQTGYKPTLFGGEVTGRATVGKNGYDLTLDVNEIDRNDIRVALRLQKYLYSQESTQVLFDSYMRLIKAFAADASCPVSSAALWDPKEAEAATQLGRGPVLKSTWPETLDERIAQVAANNKDREAVKDSYGTTLSYDEVQRRAQSISAALSTAGISEDSRVAVMQQPSTDWICSLLGLWHAGATYVPLDMRNPPERLAVIASAAKPSAILVHDETVEDVQKLHSDAIVINVSKLDISSETTRSKAKATTAAAILFTSGSTGVPKGVVLPHSALRNTIEGLTNQYQLGSERVLQQSAYSFDFSLDQMMVGLVNGGSLYVPSREDRMNPTAIASIVANEKITYTRATPTEYNSWMSYGDDLAKATEWSFAWAGGEVMPPSLRQSFAALKLSVRLFNSYGPAETVTCTKIEVPYNVDDDEDSGEIPVGHPLPNYTVSIVDNNLDVVPQGVSGEIVIGGPSVAWGYLNNERLSDTKFVNLGHGNGVTYRTGDVGYLRKDGALMFTGRLAGDLQVKIRGMRVDLQDIESSILNTADGDLERAVVTARDGDLLVAHVQFSQSGGYQDESEQKAFLRSLRFMLPLPVYMIPTTFIAVDKLPISVHGKVDRAAVRALPLPQADQKRSEATLTDTESKLLGIWKEALAVRSQDGNVEIDNQTTFFELGGDSLLLVKLQILINMRFGVKLTLLDLFGAVSLCSMASKIESAPKADNIDWDAETTLDESLLKEAEQQTQDSSMAAPIKTSDCRVLVTGATGYTGSRIVQAFAAMDRVSEIHCVATRSGGAALEALSDKIKIHPGNLAAPRLGLRDSTWSSLANDVDLIVHAGVSRSMLDSYQTLRGANFESTKTLVHLAAARRIPIHFISSGSLSTLESDTPPTGGSLGYLASKWASEKYLSNASEKLGLPVAIHRITPPAATTDIAETQTEALLADLTAMAKTLGATPSFNSQATVLHSVDLIQSQPLVERIVGATESTSQQQVEVLQHHCDATIDLQSAARCIATGENADLPQVPFAQWLGRAKKPGFEWLVASMDNFPLPSA